MLFSLVYQMNWLHCVMGILISNEWFIIVIFMFSSTWILKRFSWVQSFYRKNSVSCFMLPVNLYKLKTNSALLIRNIFLSLVWRCAMFVSVWLIDNNSSLYVTCQAFMLYCLPLCSISANAYSSSHEFIHGCVLLYFVLVILTDFVSLYDAFTLSIRVA